MFIAYVPSASVKDIIIQPDTDERRRKWISKILEFDLEMRPTKWVNGQGLAKFLSETNYKALGVNFIDVAQKIDRVSCLIRVLKSSLH